MHTDPSTIWVICYQRTTQERRPSSLILRFYDADAGRILIDGQDIACFITMGGRHAATAINEKDGKRVCSPSDSSHICRACNVSRTPLVPKASNRVPAARACAFGIEQSVGRSA